MKRYVLAAVAAAIIVSGQAFAQDQGRWAGPEIGIQGGYGWGTSSGDVSSTIPVPPAPPAPPAPPVGPVAGPLGSLSHYNISPDGALLGAHLGYNWQFNRIVLGLEGDAEGVNVSGNYVQRTAPTFSVHSRMDFDASIRGRLGFAFRRVLLYGTGGVAFGDIRTAYTVPLGTSIGEMRGVRVGWTAGAGLEYALNRRWSVGAEYRYTDLGHATFTNTAAGVTDSNEFNFSAVRLRISYRFAPPPPPPPTPMPAAAPAAAAPPPPRTFLVFFGFDRSMLTPDARKTLEAAAFTYRKSGIARVQVSGYTDAAGTQAYNLRLSHRRAATVAAYLAAQGVPRHVMVVRWFGKLHQRVPTANGVREPQNRRVEIVMP
ncbi:MAG: OmpA family protein [Stellaceae bacterium]